MGFLLQEAVELDLIHFSTVKGIVTFPLNDSSFLSSILTGQIGYFKDCFLKSGQWKIPESLPLLFLGPEDCRGNIVGPDGAQEKSMKQEQRGQGTTFERMT